MNKADESDAFVIAEIVQTVQIERFDDETKVAKIYRIRLVNTPIGSFPC